MRLTKAEQIKRLEEKNQRLTEEYTKKTEELTNIIGVQAQHLYTLQNVVKNLEEKIYLSKEGEKKKNIFSLFGINKDKKYRFLKGGN